MNTDLLSFETCTVERFELPAEVEGFSLDAPVANVTNSGHSLLVAGWVVGREPYSVPSVDIMSGDALLKRVPVQVSRSDVSAYLGKPEVAGDKFGFHAYVGILGLPKNSRLEIIINLYDPRDQSRRKEKIAMIQGRGRNCLLTNSKYQPLMLTAIGRSGTTMVMQMLGEHNKVLTSGFYPYEVKQSAYWMHLLKILSSPADFDNSSHPDKFEENLGLIGHNPYNHQEFLRQFNAPENFQNYYDKILPRALVDFSVKRTDEFYELVAVSESKFDAVYFAEKFLPTHVQSVINDVYRSPREVILTRDFRDIICSAKSFNKRRGSESFGRERAIDDFDWVRRVFSTGARRVLEAWNDRKDSAIHVRYEDLILDPTTQMRRIFNYLEVDSSDVLIRKIKEKIFLSASGGHHRTSEDSKKSIARWRSDMPADLLEYCNEKLSGELKAFGYE